jgi:hypothetical protein
MSRNTARDEAANEELTARRTRFSDVCGTIDALQRVLSEEAGTVATGPEALESWVDDALFMLARMEPRLREYQRFREEIVSLTAALQEIGDSRRQEALAIAPALRALLRRGRDLTAQERAEAAAQAEAIRAVAQDLESKLYRYKDLALALARAYQAIKGTRSWVLDESEAQAAALLPGEPEWAHWLPPSPHRERIRRYLRAGRAHVLPAPDNEQPPMLQFEDGGVMPLPAVRWSDEVRNFYLVDASPSSRGVASMDRLDDVARG